MATHLQAPGTRPAAVLCQSHLWSTRGRQKLHTPAVAVVAPAWLRPSGRCKCRLTVRASAGGGDQQAESDTPASAPAPAEEGLQSHPLPSSELPDQRSASEPRFEDDFEFGTGVSIDASDDAAPSVALRASSQATAVAAEPASPPQSLLDKVPGGAPGRIAAISLAGFLGFTLVIAVVRGVLKFRSPKAKRIRNVNKNKAVVETINRYLPQRRSEFGKGEARGLKMRTGFSGTEIFRKYLWYLLRERSFDVDAVADMQQLKEALALSDDEVAAALLERSERIYKEYGNVMLDTEGMTKTGIERKATCRALFSKLLYLAESEELLPSADAAKRRSLVADVFGATEDDASQLRIVSLYEVDAGRVEELASEPNLPEDPRAEE